MKDNSTLIMFLAGITIGFILGFYAGEKKTEDKFQVFVEEKDGFCQPSLKLMYRYWEYRK